jgi:hypothetical protein
MPLLPRLSSLWRNLFHKSQAEQELDEAYVNELKRRWKLTHGQDLRPEFYTRTMPKE